MNSTNELPAVLIDFDADWLDQYGLMTNALDSLKTLDFTRASEYRGYYRPTHCLELCLFVIGKSSITQQIPWIRNFGKVPTRVQLGAQPAVVHITPEGATVYVGQIDYILQHNKPPTHLDNTMKVASFMPFLIDGVARWRRTWKVTLKHDQVEATPALLAAALTHANRYLYFPISRELLAVPGKYVERCEAETLFSNQRKNRARKIGTIDQLLKAHGLPYASFATPVPVDRAFQRVRFINENHPSTSLVDRAKALIEADKALLETAHASALTAIA